MSDILVCDGSNLFFRAFYAMSDESLQNSDGQDTTAIYVFLKHLRYLIEQEQPRECYMIFDLGRDARKKALHKGYKENRTKDLSVLSGYDLTIELNQIESKKRQREVVSKIVETLPIKTVILHQVEGDIVISYIARHFANQGDKVLIASNDKDFYQMLSDDNIRIFNAHKREYVDKLNYKKSLKADIPIHSLRLYKCMLGDDSDNINGINGMGNKRIEQVLAGRNLVTVEDLYNALTTDPILNKKFGKYFASSEALAIMHRNMELVDLINPHLSIQSLEVIMKAIECKPSYSKMDFADILIKENIMSIVNNIDQYMQPFMRLLK